MYFFISITNGRFSMREYFFIAGIFICIVFSLGISLNIRKKNRQIKLYMQYFEECFTGNIRTTLQEIQKRYRRQSEIWLSIHKALFYLEHSIRRDYAGALQYIESTLDSQKVNKMHQEYLEKIPVTYYLPKLR